MDGTVVAGAVRFCLEKRKVGRQPAMADLRV